MRIWLSLGSNLGDREATIREAFRQLGGVCEGLVLSSLYETEPMYVAAQPRFLNAVAAGTTRLAPRELLAAVHAVERSLGRDRSAEQRYGPRTIDVDILLYEGILSDDPDLTLPHPRLAERAFVLVPLLELSPDLADPRTGEPYAVALARVGRAGVYSAPAG
ncbi:MAG: 2-amino-4-hydroxy-6-hydroxymethyldihydropteridine diphosphokinase [Spirochaetes bacterium RBG_13_68_11]|nr:MAG: 2-amino-4-hydroxy-6-hydroxymethyldihydropteridine diphosphokinase [Spirochaetes bacterium RBG_13_68_11]